MNLWPQRQRNKKNGAATAEGEKLDSKLGKKENSKKKNSKKYLNLVPNTTART